MKKILLLLVLVSLTPLAFANTYTINFEQYSEFTQITNQYSADYVEFTNALELVAPDYDYYDYPPHSGSGVITNDPNDPIQLEFTGTVSSVTGWYSAPDGAVITAYDAMDNLLATVIGGDTNMSNAMFTIASPGAPIVWLDISANDGADSETVDDINYTVTPEPESLILLGTGALSLFGMMRRKLHR